MVSEVFAMLFLPLFKLVNAMTTLIILPVMIRVLFQQPPPLRALVTIEDGVGQGQQHMDVSVNTQVSHLLNQTRPSGDASSTRTLTNNHDTNLK